MTKRVCILGFAMLLSVAGALAQDIIMLRTGDDIEALVQEIGTDEVKYKKFDNPNGPNYTLKKSEIFMIRYENGAKDVFKDKEPDPPTNPKDVQSQNNNRQDAPVDYNTFLQLRRDDAKMAEFLKTNDGVLYEQFYRGASLKNTGGALLGVGLLFTAVGGMLEIIGFNDIEDGEITKDGSATMIAGGVVLAAGQIFIITSIPLSAVGGSLKRRAADSYERKYFNNRTAFQPLLNFGITGNGVGLALKF